MRSLKARAPWTEAIQEGAPRGGERRKVEEQMPKVKMVRPNTKVADGHYIYYAGIRRKIGEIKSKPKEKMHNDSTTTKTRKEKVMAYVPFLPEVFS